MGLRDYSAAMVVGTDLGRITVNTGSRSEKGMLAFTPNQGALGSQFSRRKSPFSRVWFLVDRPSSKGWVPHTVEGSTN